MISAFGMIFLKIEKNNDFLKNIISILIIAWEKNLCLLEAQNGGCQRKF